MAAFKDIALDKDGDLLFSNGDFKIVESDQQHIVDIINENEGAYKQFPLVGVGINKYLNASNANNILLKNIKKQLEADGYHVNNILFNNNDLTDIEVDAIRNS